MKKTCCLIAGITVVLLLTFSLVGCPPIDPPDPCDGEYSGKYLWYTKTFLGNQVMILIDPDCVDCEADLESYGGVNWNRGWTQAKVPDPNTGEDVVPYWKVCKGLGKYARVCTRDCDEDPHEVFFVDSNLSELLLRLSDHVDVSDWHYQITGPFGNAAQSENN